MHKITINANRKSFIVLIARILLIIVSLSLTLKSQTDSVYQKNLRLLINAYQFLDSAYPSALHEIHLDSITIDTLQRDLNVAKKDINNQNIVIGNLEIDNSFLRSQAAILKAKLESKWGLLEYSGVGVLILIIGILGGMQL